MAPWAVAHFAQLVIQLCSCSIRSQLYLFFLWEFSSIIKISRSPAWSFNLHCIHTLWQLLWSLTRGAMIISDQALCLNLSMCSTVAHHPRTRQSERGLHWNHRFSRSALQHVSQPWLSRSAPLQLTTQTHSRRTVHAVAVGTGWCTLLVLSWVPVCCQEADAKAKAKLWVHYGSLPCCLNIGLSVYTEPSKSPERHQTSL